MGWEEVGNCSIARVSPPFNYATTNLQRPTFRDFEGLLGAFGFVHRRTKGSHRQYVHPKVGAIMTVNPAGKDAHRYQVELLLELVEQYGLHIDG